MNIKDIAKIAGVSVSTVSKIVNGKDEHIRPATKEKVLAIVKEYNYTPYAKIKNTNTGKTFTAGLLIHLKKGHSVFISRLSECLESFGYHLLILNSSGSQETERKNISYLCSHSPDILIWKPLCEESLSCQRELDKFGIKYLLLGHLTKDSLHLDPEELAYQGISRLIQARHRNIAFFYEGKGDSFFHVSLMNGFRQCMLDHALFFHEKLFHRYTGEDCLNFIKANQITAVFTDSISLGTKIYQEFHSRGYRIPFYLSILAAGQAEENQLISSVSLPEGEFACRIGELAVSLSENDCRTLENSAYAYPVTPVTIDVPHTLRDEKIVVLGSINIDTIFNIQHFPAPSISSHTTSYSVSPGGKGANHAVGVSRFHHNVSIIGKIGNDPESDMIYSVLNENHVDLSALTRDKTYSTGKAFIYIQPDGANARSILDGANMAIDEAYIEKVKQVFEHTRYFIVSTEIPLEAVNRSLEIAKENDCVTILKPVHLKTLDKLRRDKIDILVPNTVEASILTGGISDTDSQLSFFSQMGIPNIIITSWTNGCYLKTADSVKYYPPNHFELIDSTGGSDAFISALASYLLYGYSIEKSVEIANYAAGFCISRQGIIPSLIDRTSLEIYINKINPEVLIK